MLTGSSVFAGLRKKLIKLIPLIIFQARIPLSFYLKEIYNIKKGFFSSHTYSVLLIKKIEAQDMLIILFQCLHQWFR